MILQSLEHLEGYADVDNWDCEQEEEEDDDGYVSAFDDDDDDDDEDPSEDGEVKRSRY